MYASLADLRDEGVALSAASDARLTRLSEEATATIDRVTGWFFEPRARTFRVGGRDAPTVALPVPPIRLTRVLVEYETSSGATVFPYPFVLSSGYEVPLDASSLVVGGAPVGPGFEGARLTLRHGFVFPKGHGNVVAEGVWGYTEDDGTPDGRTPLAIRRACMLLVLGALPPLADESAFDARSRWRIVEERTRDQSYRLDPLKSRVLALTGDPEVDALLAPFVRPSAFGAA